MGEDQRTGDGTIRVVPEDTGTDEGPTYRELYDEAKARNIEGRSKMTKVELERALAR